MGNLCGKRVSKPIPFDPHLTADQSREKEPLLHSPQAQAPLVDPSPPSSPLPQHQDHQEHHQHHHEHHQQHQETEVTSHRQANDHDPPSSKPIQHIGVHVDTQVSTPIPLLPPPPSAHPSSSLVTPQHQQQQQQQPQAQAEDQYQVQPQYIVVHTHTEVPVVIPPRPPSPSPFIPTTTSPLSSSSEQEATNVIEVVHEVQQEAAQGHVDISKEEEDEELVVTAKVQEKEQETIIVEAPQQSAKKLVTEEYTTAHIEQPTTPVVKPHEEAPQQTPTEPQVEPSVQVIAEEPVVELAKVEVSEEEDSTKQQVEVTEAVIKEDKVEVIEEDSTKDQVIAEEKDQIEVTEEVKEDKVEVPEEDSTKDQVTEDSVKDQAIEEDSAKDQVKEEDSTKDQVEATEEVVREDQEQVVEEEERPVDEEGEEPVADVREEITFDITADIPEETEMEMFKRLFQSDPETGFLERDRLGYILEVLGIMEGNVLEFIWDQFDADGSGEIDFKEFCQMMYQLRAIRKNFEAADVNGDKSISPSELVPVLNKLGITMDSQNIFDILKLFDANQDEEIDFSEFLPLSIFLTTLEQEYKEFINTRIARTKWLRPLLSGDIAREEQVAEQMEALLTDDRVPSMGDVVSIIVLAVNNVVYL